MLKSKNGDTVRVMDDIEEQNLQPRQEEIGYTLPWKKRVVRDLKLSRHRNV